jgi:beta-phosphoglucomutase
MIRLASALISQLRLIIFSMIKAVIFDLDGVLVEAKDWHYECLNIALSVFGAEISYEDHLQNFDGLPTSVKLNKLNERGLLPSRSFALINQLKQVYTQEYFETRCFPSYTIKYLMQKLAEKDIKIAIASNSIRDTVSKAIESLDINQYVEFYLGNEDVDKPKPSPNIYNKALTMLNINPNEALILEDNKNGLKAAYSSGANVLKIDEVSDTNHINVFNKIKEVTN